MGSPTAPNPSDPPWARAFPGTRRSAKPATEPKLGKTQPKGRALPAWTHRGALLSTGGCLPRFPNAGTPPQGQGNGSQDGAGNSLLHGARGCGSRRRVCHQPPPGTGAAPWPHVPPPRVPAPTSATASGGPAGAVSPRQPSREALVPARGPPAARRCDLPVAGSAAALKKSRKLGAREPGSRQPRNGPATAPGCRGEPSWAASNGRRVLAFAHEGPAAGRHGAGIPRQGSTGSVSPDTSPGPCRDKSRRELHRGRGVSLVPSHHSGPRLLSRQATGLGAAIPDTHQGAGAPQEPQPPAQTSLCFYKME